MLFLKETIVADKTDKKTLIGEPIQFMGISIATITEYEIQGDKAVCKVEALPGWEKRVAQMLDNDGSFIVKLPS